ncbi:Putative auto-transporter adhesin, head GIN domain [Rhizobiales bacterium GAS191]|nr:Putative auto-transporter adhesin, head GIN domain [Rhizobiales bacterium GAS113]SED87288.1 Putative auto-transporter adhesin, head GIN domain [Rhizobiales bacterium GAS191]
MNGHLRRIATAALLISVICLALGAWTGGLGWASQKHRWWRVSALGCEDAKPGAGAAQPGSVSLAWDADDRIDIDIPATVDYRPGATAEAVVSGDPELVRHVRFAGGKLEWDADFDCFPVGKLAVRLTGPAITNWGLHGASKLNLSDLDQDALELGISGSGDVVANGTAQRIALRISGSGAADLAKLAVKSARLRVSGSGEADIAAQEEADIHISGSGSVILHGHPTQIQSHISGSGRVREVP